MNKLLHDQVMAFLRDPAQTCLRFREGGWSRLLFRVPLDDETDALYLLGEYGDTPIRLGEKAEYAGIYSRLRDELHDVCYGLREAVEDRYATDRSSTVTLIEAGASRLVVDLVGDGPVEETDQAESVNYDRDYFTQYLLDQEASKHFYERTEPAFMPVVHIRDITATQYAQAINHPDEAVRYWAERYIVRQAKYINLRLWELPLVKQRLVELEATEGEHHLRRAIAESIGDQKTVRVDVQRGGKSLTVRMDADELKRYNSTYYTTWHMDAPSRRAFAEAFGRNADLYARDIVRVVYGRAVLYERDDAHNIERVAS